MSAFVRKVIDVTEFLLGIIIFGTMFTLNEEGH